MARGANIAMFLAAVLAAGLLSACGESESESESEAERPVAPVVTDDAAVTFAPVVQLHSRERWWPMAATEFIGFSILTWSNDPCLVDETVAIGGPRRRLNRDEPSPIVDLRRLAGRTRPYRARPYRPDCVGRRAARYETDQHTRPFDRTGRPPGLQPGAGFSLGVLTDERYGHGRIRRRGSQAYLRPVPAYFERRPQRVDGGPGLRLTYWLFHGFNGYPENTPVSYQLDHEGDWERLDVLLRRAGRADRWAPVAAVYHPHGRRREVPWRSLELVAGGGSSAQRTHPVVYSARDNHAPYPEPGRRTVRIPAGGEPLATVDHAAACDDCPLWRTWERLRPVRAEPWYGYGGAWGSSGDTGATSGPLGPSPYLPGPPPAADGGSDTGNRDGVLTGDDGTEVRAFGDRRDHVRVVAVFRRMQQAFRRGDMAATCSGVDPFMLSQFRSAQVGQDASCERRMADFATSLRRRGAKQPRLRFLWVRSYGPVASVWVEYPSGKRIRVPFKRAGGGWALELGSFPNPEVLNATLSDVPKNVE